MPDDFNSGANSLTLRVIKPFYDMSNEITPLQGAPQGGGSYVVPFVLFVTPFRDGQVLPCRSKAAQTGT